MPRLKSEYITVPLTNGEYFSIELFPKSNNFIIEKISAEEARENGEAQIQLREGQTYEYTHPKGFKLRCNNRVVKASKLSPGNGTINPGNYVGTLTFQVINFTTSNIVGSFQLEIQSIKTDYRTDYRFMLQDIAERCTELIMQHNVPVSHNFIPDHSRQHKTVYQRFAFIKSMINSEEFDHAIHKIIQSPVVVWKQEEEVYKNVVKLKRLGYKQIRQLSTAANKSNAKLLTFDKTPSIDANENRFIKHALAQFLDTCTLFLSKIEDKDRDYQQVVKLQEKLWQYLSHDVFKEIGPLQTMPLNSPILQRKEGYREVLRVWIMFEVASQLSWTGGNDVYQGGKKDVAALYEYWIFFKLFDSVIKVFKLSPKNIEDLIGSTKNGLELKLKRGNSLVIQDVCTMFSRKLHVELSYNRAFPKYSAYPNSGSWTTEFRPDFTLSIWPHGLRREEAEREELITHIHFDAKYKTEFIQDSDDQEKNAIVDSEKKIIKGLKNEDLIKMHAYKDAIRRTGGAYVLYPGTQPCLFKVFHEVLPGIGAFPILPSINNNGIVAFEKFLSDVVSLLLNRSSQREKLALKTFQIHNSQPAPLLNALLPEAIKLNRNLLPEETFVLIGYYNNNQHLSWIKERKLFNIKIPVSSIPFYVDRSIIGARYLLLHNPAEPCSTNILKLASKGGRILTKKDLIKLGYPTLPTQGNYLVFDIEDDIEPEFLQFKWNVTKLKKYMKGKGQALPFGVDLNELMQCAIL